MPVPHQLMSVSALKVDPYNGNVLRPMYDSRGHGYGDIRTVSAKFFLSMQQAWEVHGETILKQVAEKYPELFLASMVKLCQVTKVEVGQPGDFAKLGNKEEIAQKLEGRAGPKARQLFEKFVKDIRALEGENEAAAKAESLKD